MKNLKVLINCPGSWSYGLDSPERGEGRWCQNWAKLLAKYGHEVYACSMGTPKPRTHYGVHLMPDNEVGQLGSVDLFIDASWWYNKVQPVKYDIAFHVHWGLEDFLLRPDFPKKEAICFPYKSSKANFICDRNPHKDRTFFMPIPLRDGFDAPAFDRPDVLIPHQASPSLPIRPDSAVIAVNKIYTYIKDNPNMKAHWLFWDRLAGSPHIEPAINNPSNSPGYGVIPYNQVVDIISKCKVSLPLNSPSCIIDVIAQGVPYLAWERGSFFTDIAKSLGVSISPDEETEERIGEVIDTLMTDKKIYTEYVLALQDLMSDHTEEKAIKCFNRAVETLMG